jgi:hypothetical protein
MPAVAVAIAIAIAPAGDPTDPFSAFEGMGERMPLLVGLVCAAVLVAWLAGRQYRRSRRGGDVGKRTGVRRDAELRRMVVALEDAAATPIAKAQRGPVRVRAKLESASGNLGGAPGRECVWRNRVGAPTDAAVGAELVVLADASGRCGLVQLERARVVAPTEKPARDRETISLYLGDEVEVFACFAPAEARPAGETEARISGTLGADARVEVRLVERPPAPAEPPTAPTETP